MVIRWLDRLEFSLVGKFDVWLWLSKQSVDEEYTFIHSSKGLEGDLFPDIICNLSDIIQSIVGSYENEIKDM